ncbi:BnaA03g55210D [Brassica napus]|uniref:BnaA03g55210D protein n=2 Tax=Brassica TaxID=3705 RepID=A0A078IQF8_BRANA|nr:BnaA03g55210D [Brassica napus]
MKLDSKVFIFLKRNKRSDRRGEERGRNRGWFLYGEDCRVLRVTMRRKKGRFVGLSLSVHCPHAEDLQFYQLLDSVRSGLSDEQRQRSSLHIERAI